MPFAAMENLASNSLISGTATCEQCRVWNYFYLATPTIWTHDGNLHDQNILKLFPPFL